MREIHRLILFALAEGGAELDATSSASSRHLNEMLRSGKVVDALRGIAQIPEGTNLGITVLPMGDRPSLPAGTYRYEVGDSTEWKEQFLAVAMLFDLVGQVLQGETTPLDVVKQTKVARTSADRVGARLALTWLMDPKAAAFVASSASGTLTVTGPDGNNEVAQVANLRDVIAMRRGADPDFNSALEAALPEFVARRCEEYVQQVGSTVLSLKPGPSITGISRSQEDRARQVAADHNAALTYWIYTNDASTRPKIEHLAESLRKLTVPLAPGQRPEKIGAEPVDWYPIAMLGGMALAVLIAIGIGKGSGDPAVTAEAARSQRLAEIGVTEKDVNRYFTDDPWCAENIGKKFGRRQFTQRSKLQECISTLKDHAEADGR